MMLPQTINGNGYRGRVNGASLTEEQKRAAESAILENPHPPRIDAAEEERLLATDAALAESLAKHPCWGELCTEIALCPNCRTRRCYLALTIHREKHGKALHPSEDRKEPKDTEPAPPHSCVEIIRDYLREKYEPTFRSGAAIYSNKLGREVSKAEATDAPSSDLIEPLQTAWDFPKGQDGQPRRNAVPAEYRKWAPIAWKDIMGELPEEEDAGEIAESAQERFRGIVADAMRTLENFSYTPDGEDRRTVQRRSLIAWCKAWAKPGRWQAVRTLSLWTKLDTEGRLCVALNTGLFGQIGMRSRAPWTYRTFAKFAAQYGIGERGCAGGNRAIDLSQDFIEELLAGPVDGEPDGRADGKDLLGECNREFPSTLPSTLPSSRGAMGETKEPL